MDNYIEMRPGWLFQLELDKEHEKPVYDKQYSGKYNSYPKMKEMSELRYELMKKHFKQHYSVMDVGYGNGAFLDEANLHGWTTFGYDISDYQLNYNHQRVVAMQHPAEVVTFFDSLEHFETMNLQTVLNNLNCYGLIISVPWCHWGVPYFDFKTWKHRRPNEHFHHFNVYGMYDLLDDAGYKVLEVNNQEDIIRTPYHPLLPNIMTVVAQRI